MGSRERERINENKIHYHNYQPYFKTGVPKVMDTSKYYIDNKAQFNKTQKQMAEFQIPMCLVQDEKGKLHQLVYTLPVNEYSKCLETLWNNQNINTCKPAITKMEELEMIGKFGGKLKDSPRKQRTAEKNSKTKTKTQGKIKTDWPKNLNSRKHIIHKTDTKTVLTNTSIVKANKNQSLTSEMNDFGLNDASTHNSHYQNSILEKDSIKSMLIEQSQMKADIFKKDSPIICDNNLTESSDRTSKFENENFHSTSQDIEDLIQSNNLYEKKENDNVTMEDNDSGFEDVNSIYISDNSPSCMSLESLEDFFLYPQSVDSFDYVENNKGNDNNHHISESDLENLFNDLSALNKDDVFSCVSYSDKAQEKVTVSCDENMFDIANDLNSNEQLDFRIFEENSYLKT